MLGNMLSFTCHFILHHHYLSVPVLLAQPLHEIAKLSLVVPMDSHEVIKCGLCKSPVH